MSALTDSARGRRVTRNRARIQRLDGAQSEPSGHPVGALLTLVLLAPAAAVLVSRVHAMVRLDGPGSTSGCSGAGTLGPVLQAGLPVVILVIAVPVALLSLGHRARGWMWLLAALLGTLALEVALRMWLPVCL